MNNKLEFIESLIHLIVKHKLSFGLPNVNGFESDKRFIFNPLLVNGVLVLLLFRDFTNILLRNELMSKLLCDFSQNWDFNIEWKLCEIFSISLNLLVVLNNYFDLCNKSLSKIILKETEFRFLNQSIIVPYVLINKY